MDQLKNTLEHPHAYTYVLIAVGITVIACIATAIYMEAGDEGVYKWIMGKFLRFEAEAEKKALEKAGEEKVENLLKERLKNNPVVSNEELNRVAPGLGDEAAKEGMDFLKNRFHQQ